MVTTSMITSKQPDEVKAVIVGDGGVGKTSMLLSYTTGGIMTDYVPTCFDTYSVDMKLKERIHTLCLIDTAGQETYDRLRTLSYYNTDVFLVCFSVEDPDSFDNVRTKWVPEIREYRPNTPFILVGTQVDLRGSVVDLTGQCVTTAQGKKMAKKLGADVYMECSALEGIGLEDIFRRALVSAVSPKRKRRFWQTLKMAFKKKDSSFLERKHTLSFKG